MKYAVAWLERTCKALTQKLFSEGNAETVTYNAGCGYAKSNNEQRVIVAFIVRHAAVEPQLTYVA